MSCERTRKLLDLYLDDELGAEQCLEIERHLDGCRACRDARALRAAVHHRAPYFTAPEAAVRKLRARFGQSGVVAAPVRAPTPHWFNPAAIAAAALLGAAVTWWLAAPPDEDRILREVAANHSRSLMVTGRITDVSSSDMHTVKPWFNGRIDYSPPVVDLTAQGFVLVGGRLDYLDERPVAALVYRHRQHFINLFVWPAANTADAAMRAFARHGYHLIEWTSRGMRYWAVSDLNPTDLNRFGNLLANTN